MLTTFKLHIENANPRIDLLEPFKQDLEDSESMTNPEKGKLELKIDKLEKDIEAFIESIDDIITELKSYRKNESAGVGK